MADDVILKGASANFVTATDEIADRHFQKVKVTFGADGTATDVSTSNRFPVTLGLTDTELRASPVPVSGTFYQATQPVSIAAPVVVTGTFWQATQPVSIASAVAVTGTFWQATQPISAASLPLPTDAATETTLAAINAVFKAEDSAAGDGDKGIPLLAMRSSTDAVTTSNDGDYTLLKIDEEGRLKVSSKPASYADITGDITAVQASIGTPVAGGTVAGDVSRASNVMMFCTGTFSAVNVTFEGSLEASGDTNWFGLQAVRSNANTIETATGNLSAAPAYAWELSVNALRRVRVRCTARTSGTQSWRFVQGTYATEPIPAAQATATQPVSGTVTATVAGATLGIPNLFTDVVSAALTTTTTTGTITPTAGSSYRVVIPVTVVSGTNPTLDIAIEESDDSGTNWFKIYDFPRITTTGVYRTPIIPYVGNRVRYVQTVGGTTPSFTRAINRLQLNIDGDPVRQLIDRTIVPNTLNSTTPSIDTRDGGNRVQLVVNMGAITTTAPAFQLEGSDDNGATWYSIGSPLTGVASSTVQLTVTDLNSALVRARVSTAGSGATLGYVMIKGHD